MDFNIQLAKKRVKGAEHDEHVVLGKLQLGRDVEVFEAGLHYWKPNRLLPRAPSVR